MTEDVGLCNINLYMIRHILPLVVAACIAPSFAGEAWLTDMDAAKKQAAEQNKALMIEFTGSDWCPPCMKLRADVLSKEDFLKAAQKNYVLLELDFPNGNSALKESNQKFAEEYNIQGFPTVLFTDASGKPFGSFVGGIPKEAVMKALETALQNKEAMKAAMEKAKKATTDDAKIAALMEVLKLVPTEPEGLVDKFYGDVKNQILQLDKDDKLGMRAADAKAATIKKEQSDLQTFLTEKLSKEKDPEKVLALVKEYPNRDKLQPETQQDLLMMEFQAFIGATGNVDEAVLMLDKVQAAAPETRLGRSVPMIKKSVLSNKDQIKAQFDAAKKAKSQ